VTDELQPTNQPILSSRAVVDEDDVAGFVRGALRNIRSQLHEQHQIPSGPPFTICRQVGLRRVDVEAGWPLDHDAHSTGTAHTGTLPTALSRTNRPGVNADTPLA
jgi:hypothetical protein